MATEYRYTYLKEFQGVWDSGMGHGRSKGEAVECKKMQGMKFKVLSVLRAGTDGPDDPSEDMHLCRFENDFEMHCWAEEVVATVNGEPLVVKVGGREVRRGHDKK